MDDLLGEDWQQPAKPPNTNSGTSAFSSAYSSFRASPALPLSGTASPASLSRPSSTVNGSKATPNDSFGNLLAAKPSRSGPGLSMQERQKQLLEEKRRQQEDQAKMWNSLGSGTSTPEVRQPSPAVLEDEDDILAAFSKDAPVNKASHFAPPPSSGAVSGRSTPAIQQATSSQQAFDDDDDPFGLNNFVSKSNGHVPKATSTPAPDDDDILGDLGRPVTEQRPAPAGHDLQKPTLDRADSSSSSDSSESDRRQDSTPNDRGLAELIDMGFPADTAKIALAESGGDVQGAVGWLLQQAHEESRQRSRAETATEQSRDSSRGSRSRADQEPTPSWMRQDEGRGPATRRRDGASTTNGDRDSSPAAQEFGTKFFKSANALWKAGQKQMAKTIAEFQQDGDSSQPKWLRDGGSDAVQPASRQRPAEPRATSNFTNEAALLDAPRQQPAKPSRSGPSAHMADTVLPQRPTRQALSQRPSPQQPAIPDKKPATKLSRQDVEEQSAQAYVSPARRKGQTAKPAAQPQSDVDLFSSTPATMSPLPSVSDNSSPPTVARRSAAPKSAPPPSQPKVPPRSIPLLSASALSSSNSHRKAGSEHFKRGDYAAAHESYTAALAPLPATHPIAVILLSNRSLTALKTGDAKVAVSDADRALEIIGPGLGVGESIDLGVDGVKQMKEFYGKAIMRKAEALEHMEKYADAAAVWRLAIAAGAGGSVSLRGRDRCEKAASPKPVGVAAAPKAVRTTASRPGKTAPPQALGNSIKRSTITSVSSNEAVRRLREANAEAEKADDEKFALSDVVDAKLTAWRGGKTDNLRALLQSMDAVLWEGAGWKKVGMSDLVMPNKVKIVYMKAIGKVHPDKIPQDATTEQRMVSAAVFATLNEAWDKFKTENNL